MKHILAVYDVDPVYAARFAEVVNQKEKIPFEVVAFSSIERLRAFAAEHPVKLLLLGEHVPAEEKESIRAEKVILLSDNGGKPVSPSVPCVYKYQSSDAIVRDVMTWYGESPGDLPEVSGRGLAKVLGVYSPVGRCLKTSFALTIGKLLAQEERVLYLNLEEFSGLSVLMKEEYKSDLSDLLYFYNGGSYNSLRLSSVVHTMGELDYIPPVRYPEDLDQAGEEAIAGLIRAIAGESAYDTLVVDIGSGRRTALSVMKLCRVIYMPIREDPVSLAKLKELEQYFSQTGNGMLTVIAAAITSRFQKHSIPTHIQLEQEVRGLRRNSVILLEQVRTIDRMRLKRYIGSLNGSMMQKVDRAILISFGLKEQNRA